MENNSNQKKRTKSNIPKINLTLLNAANVSSVNILPADKGNATDILDSGSCQNECTC